MKNKYRKAPGAKWSRAKGLEDAVKEANTASVKLSKQANTTDEERKRHHALMREWIKAYSAIRRYGG